MIAIKCCQLNIHTEYGIHKYIPFKDHPSLLCITVYIFNKVYFYALMVNSQFWVTYVKVIPNRFTVVVFRRTRQGCISLKHIFLKG